MKRSVAELHYSYAQGMNKEDCDASEEKQKILGP
jgi:hypothetical protein